MDLQQFNSFELLTMIALVIFFLSVFLGNFIPDDFKDDDEFRLTFLRSSLKNKDELFFIKDNPNYFVIDKVITYDDFEGYDLLKIVKSNVLPNDTYEEHLIARGNLVQVVISEEIERIKGSIAAAEGRKLAAEALIALEEARQERLRLIRV